MKMLTPDVPASAQKMAHDSAVLSLQQIRRNKQKSVSPASLHVWQLGEKADALQCIPPTLKEKHLMYVRHQTALLATTEANTYTCRPGQIQSGGELFNSAENSKAGCQSKCDTTAGCVAF